MDQVSEKGGALSLLIPSVTHVQFAFGQHCARGALVLACRTDQAAAREETDIPSFARTEFAALFRFTARSAAGGAAQPAGRTADVLAISLRARAHIQGLTPSDVVQFVGATVPRDSHSRRAKLKPCLRSFVTAFRPHRMLCAGQRVRFRVGVLDGIEGVVSAIRNEKSLVVSVDLIQKSVSISN